MHIKPCVECDGDMELPRVGPLGLVHYPQSYVTAAREYPSFFRMVALGVLGSFIAVTIITTVHSLGTYCLTTWGSNLFQGFY